MVREADSWDDPIGAEVYDDVVEHGELYRELARQLIETLKPKPPATVLDLACGSGLVSRMLDPSLTIVGVDRSRAMLDVAQRKRERAQLTQFIECDPTELPFADARFDLSLCSAAFWHFPAVSSVFAELTRVLRPGGRFAFNVPATQLIELEDGEQPTLMHALTDEGLRRFGQTPSPAGPLRRRDDLLAAAEQAGLKVRQQKTFEAGLRQAELSDLLAVPAIGARMYPDAKPSDLQQWIEAASDRVDGELRVAVRWWQVLLER